MCLHQTFPALAVKYPALSQNPVSPTVPQFAFAGSGLVVFKLEMEDKWYNFKMLPQCLSYTYLGKHGT